MSIRRNIHRNTRIAIALVALTVLIPVLGYARDGNSEAAVDALMAPFARDDAPGVAISVYRDGRTVLARGYGLADLESRTRITPQTPFHAASVSKQFAAFAVALLAHEGRLDLDADIRRYLPYVPEFGTPITTRQLVHHTSGLRDQWTLFRMGGRDLRDLLRQGQVIDMVKRQRALDFAPGTDHLYSNTGYTLLAEIVQSVTGQTLRQFTTQRMFEPLGMSRTFFYDDVSELIPGRANSYDRAADGTWHRALLNYETVGATSLITTVEDLARWAANFSRPRSGDRALIAQIMQGGTLLDGTRTHYAFGLFDLSHDGRRAVSHSGGDAAFRAYFIYYPDDDFAVALLANRDVDVIGTVKAVADIYLPASRAEPVRLPRVTRVPRELLESLPGLYLGPRGETITLTRDGQQLRVSEAEAMLVFRGDGSFELDRRRDEVRRAAHSFDIGERTQSTFHVVRDGRRIAAIEERPVIGLPAVRFERIGSFTANPADLAQFTGDYRSDELDITYSLSVNAGALVARSLWLNDHMSLQPVAPDAFAASGAPFSTMTFERDGNGDVIRAKIHTRYAYGVVLERLPRGR